MIIDIIESLFDTILIFIYIKQIILFGFFFDSNYSSYIPYIYHSIFTISIIFLIIIFLLSFIKITLLTNKNNALENLF